MLAAETQQHHSNLEGVVLNWDEGTLDGMGWWTPENDTYQIGAMLLHFNCLHPNLCKSIHDRPRQQPGYVEN